MRQGQEEEDMFPIGQKSLIPVKNWCFVQDFGFLVWWGGDTQTYVSTGFLFFIT